MRLAASLAAILALSSATASAPLAAQVLPQPSAENPRLQTVRWTPGQEIILTALPDTGLTVVLEPGEQVRRVAVDDQNTVEIRVSGELDSLLILPQVRSVGSGIVVQTDRRDYRFTLRTDTGLTAAYLVKVDYDDPGIKQPQEVTAKPAGIVWRYRVKGDTSVRPASISDNGIRTRIAFGPEQLLPAVFSIGPTGKEQVVNGYMRDGIFVIDRVYSQLVFRIDKDKATANRNKSGEKTDG
ncbi:hypothetical protein GRI43_00965 [Altererythrobacter luteolus]|uniref:Type IV secretion system protein VirB9 n=1 Tax=Pontixanthobacter luteolus TaxID=295089 RepID=A0A6I4V1Z9_9SPHN|nr:TrbG/VirB9 family P-type conjugative transfer protein [Pontixanthobacter luteolus]MXP45962.1 hypothetical protein [Pontixanthobacter luteolus]